LRAYGTRAGGRSRADSRRRALYIGATRARAGRALTAILRTLAGVNDHRLLRRYGALQHILRHIGHRRALRL